MIHKYKRLSFKIFGIKFNLSHIKNIQNEYYLLNGELKKLFQHGYN